MKTALIIASVSEAATGLALLVVPSLVGRLLLGEELTGVAIPVVRVTGIALIALGIASWPGPPLADLEQWPVVNSFPYHLTDLHQLATMLQSWPRGSNGSGTADVDVAGQKYRSRS